MCELSYTDTGIINQSSQSKQRGAPIWTVWYGSGHNPPCINHALMHSSSSLCQIWNINESITLCQEVTAGAAAHSWTGTRSSVDLSRRCINLKENPITESVGDGTMVCYTVKHLLIFHHEDCSGWRVRWRDADTLSYDTQPREENQSAPCWITHATFTPQLNVVRMRFLDDSVKNHTKCDIFNFPMWK